MGNIGLVRAFAGWAPGGKGFGGGGWSDALPVEVEGDQYIQYI